jgi:hypothetical protein
LERRRKPSVWEKATTRSKDSITEDHLDLVQSIRIGSAFVTMNFCLYPLRSSYIRFQLFTPLGSSLLKHSPPPLPSNLASQIPQHPPDFALLDAAPKRDLAVIPDDSRPRSRSSADTGGPTDAQSVRGGERAEDREVFGGKEPRLRRGLEGE